uniref:Uncharacterized protein n=1 Tax=Oryza sativa subsp. japonica TaxID=39947 RepID=Q7EZT8_ORYSJ|nr:hypothetical protein [Oryza sativa Japonica Group]BAD03339.1 hypothetical protein [Oryza sativa Japonica Group]
MTKRHRNEGTSYDVTTNEAAQRRVDEDKATRLGLDGYEGGQREWWRPREWQILPVRSGTMAATTRVVTVMMTARRW